MTRRSALVTFTTEVASALRSVIARIGLVLFLLPSLRGFVVLLVIATSLSACASSSTPITPTT